MPRKALSEPRFQRDRRLGAAPPEHDLLDRRAQQTMKPILIFSPSVYQRSGHALDYVLNGLAKSAAALGSLDVHVLGFHGPFVTHTPPQVTPHTCELAGCDRSKGSNALQQIKWGFQRITNGGRLVESALKLARKLNCAGVLFETFEYYSLGRQISRFQRPLRSVFHDTAFNAHQTSVPAALYKSAMAHSAAKIVRHCERTFVHGSAMRENLIRSLGINSREASRIAEISYGAATPNEFRQVERAEARRELGIANERPLLLAFGTLRKDKEFPLLLAAISQARSWGLLIAGPEGDMRFEEIHAIARRLGISDRVYCRNQFIPTGEQPVYFGAADAVVGIYSSAIRHESGTCQLTRAFLKPIIASGPPDLEAYVKKAGVGWTMSGHTPEALTETLSTIENVSVAQQSAMRERIKQCAAERSWTNVCAEVFRGWC
jgi:glycosyltransferase involved in cell wall biosynthesis